MSVDYESLFHASEVDLLVPSFSHCPPFPLDPSSSTGWWTEAQSAKARDTAFLDEKLVYYVGMSVDDGSSLESDEVSPELKQFLSHLQLSMSVSFLPPLSAPPPRREPNAPGSGSGPSQPNNRLLPPDDLTPTGKQGGVDLEFPPVTPMPQPSVKEGDEQYAGLEGQVVWEGDVLDKYKLFRNEAGGWVAVWKSEVLIEYVRTQIQNPVLALTASVTLREGPVRAGHKKGNFSIDTTTSTRTGGDIDDDETPYGQDDVVGLQEIDLLGGLAGDSSGLPTTRLGQSLRHDLSLPDRLPNPNGSASAYTPTSLSGRTPTSAGASPAGPSRDRPAPLSSIQPYQSLTTLRKSYRQVLALSPGLRVRMRTLLLPQLLPTSTQDDDENEGEKKIVLCVEVENPEGIPFEVDSVSVEITGKGGQATAELVCQPEQHNGGNVFPLRLGAMEQYNLLYCVNIASAPEERNAATGMDEAVMRSMGRGDDMRPVAIYLVGRPFRRSLVDTDSALGDEMEYPTSPFSSRWNCQLDLAGFYASLSYSNINVAQPNAGTSNRTSKSTLALPPPAPNAVAGDKRYSLATVMSQSSGGHRDSRRLTGGPGPRLPSQAMSTYQAQGQGHGRGPSFRQSQANEGLLISVKLLSRPTASGSDGGNGAGASGDQSIRPFEPFSIEVFVHNKTDEVRRFRLSVPPRDGEGQIREMMDKRRSQNPKMQDDPVLRRSLSKHLANAPPVVSLETDVRCGPLLPGASLAARIRFMPLRKGVHTIERLLVTGMGDDWNFIMSPVIDVVVE